MLYDPGIRIMRIMSLESKLWASCLDLGSGALERRGLADPTIDVVHARKTKLCKIRSPKL